MNEYSFFLLLLRSMGLSEKSKLKKEAIVKATIDLVNCNGFHGTPISKLAKLAGVSPGTIYLYFDNKQDLLNKVYLEAKRKFTSYAFANYNTKNSVEEEFKNVWFRIAEFKLNEIPETIFLAQCDNTPIIDEEVRQEGIIHLSPLLDLWSRGKEQNIIKPISDYLLYAYTITPLSFLMVMHARNAHLLTKELLENTYESAWDSIKK
ncbi:TetR/AcrR family transcriptional regulator [Flavicella marina]|uniref:TetR/AcrR family transcriptional regulator n=1 Tax=Flavicella marina TaxID=1475951 RepID=UPI002938F9DA|nr:TetR/AcrR family transcriptional regulator [Flavicella marina]